jgi:hypothetical protein
MVSLLFWPDQAPYPKVSLSLFILPELRQPLFVTTVSLTKYVSSYLKLREG